MKTRAEFGTMKMAMEFQERIRMKEQENYNKDNKIIIKFSNFTCKPAAFMFIFSFHSFYFFDNIPQRCRSTEKFRWRQLFTGMAYIYILVKCFLNSRYRRNDHRSLAFLGLGMRIVFTVIALKDKISIFLHNTQNLNIK